MATGDILKKWAASSNLTVTNLGALPTSSTYVGGWESAEIDNSSTGYDDYRITAKITLGTTLTAAQIRMYLVGKLDDSTYPSNLDGTESTEAPFTVDTEMQPAVLRLAAVVDTDTTNSDVYFLDCPSAKAVFGGNLPEKFVVCIAHASNANLAAAGSQQVTIKGSYYQVQA